MAFTRGKIHMAVVRGSINEIFSKFRKLQPDLPGANELISWWRHQMEPFSALLALCAGNSPVPGEFPAQNPVTRSFDVFFDLRLNKRWVNNREAGDLRRHLGHYDVNVMLSRVGVSIRHASCSGIGLLSRFLPCHFFPVWPDNQNTWYLWNITFIFGKCRYNWAAATPANYECKIKHSNGYNDRTNIFLNVEMNWRSFSTPAIGNPCVWNENIDSLLMVHRYYRTL